jgi:hypothetical protein
MGAAMPHPPDRNNWLTLKDANESAHEAWREKHGSASAATKNDNVQTTAVGDLSIEIEVSYEMTIFSVQSNTECLRAGFGCLSYSGRPGLDDDRRGDEGVGRDACVLSLMKEHPLSRTKEISIQEDRARPGLRCLDDPFVQGFKGRLYVLQVITQ